MARGRIRDQDRIPFRIRHRIRLPLLDVLSLAEDIDTEEEAQETTDRPAWAACSLPRVFPRASVARCVRAQLIDQPGEGRRQLRGPPKVALVVSITLDDPSGQIHADGAGRRNLHEAQSLPALVGLQRPLALERSCTCGQNDLEGTIRGGCERHLARGSARVPPRAAHLRRTGLRGTPEGSRRDGGAPIEGLLAEREVRENKELDRIGDRSVHVTVAWSRHDEIAPGGPGFGARALGTRIRSELVHGVTA